MAEEKKRIRIQEIITKLINRTNDLFQRLRVLEEKISVNSSRIDSVEKTSMHEADEIKKSIEEVKNEIKSQNKKISDLEDSIKKIIEQLKLTATKTKVKELENLFEIYNPATSSFVTREELERIIEEKINK